MQRLDTSSVRGADLHGRTIRIHAINAICPNCNEKGTFTLSNHSQPGPQNSVSADGSCPSCKEKVGFWALSPNGGGSIENTQIYISPAPKNYLSIPSDLDVLPPQLRRAFITTIECYNGGIYTATTVSGRRTLEGIFKYLVSEDKRKQPLARLIETVKAEKDLSAPLSDLSHAIRSGGNLGAHFDMEYEPDENVARQIVELLDYLISYLYVLPSKISKLEEDLGRSSTQLSAEITND